MSSTSDTASNPREGIKNHTIYRAEIGIGAYIVSATTELDAKMKAAAKYKESLSGPHIGKSVSDYAKDITLSSVNINIDSKTNFTGVYHKANGDPFIAVFSRTEPEDNAPSEKRVITLGTDFQSFNDIIYTARDIIIAPQHSGVMNGKEPLQFAPTRVDIFELSGTASFEYR